jgi:hypothetical protein
MVAIGGGGGGVFEGGGVLEGGGDPGGGVGGQDMRLWFYLSIFMTFLKII